MGVGELFQKDLTSYVRRINLMDNNKGIYNEQFMDKYWKYLIDPKPFDPNARNDDKPFDIYNYIKLIWGIIRWISLSQEGVILAIIIIIIIIYIIYLYKRK